MKAIHMEWPKVDNELETNELVTAQGNASEGDDEGCKSFSQQQDANANHMQNKKITKRRATRACLSCRARKVRCDVVQAAPCFNCRMDGFECVSVQSRRKKLRQAESACLTNRTFVNEGELFLAPKQFPQQDQASHHSNDSTLGPETTGDGGGGWPFKLSEHTDSLKRDRTYTSRVPKEKTPPSSGSPIPPFLKPLSPEMDALDSQYLLKKGALSLPSISLQNALLGAYLEYVHPYLPLLDVHEFLTVLGSRDGANGKVSLLLYHSIMFAGAAFSDMESLFAEGFATRKAAREAFYQKARILYDCDYETDRFTLIQAVLLMTYWFETAHELKNSWHWTGLAISLAYSISLHRAVGSVDMPEGQKRLRKRVWWSCYMTDRLVSLSMRTPTRINNEDCDVPILEEEDFDLVRLADTSLMMPSSCAIIRNIGLQRDLVAMCVAMSQLCISIGHVLQTHYSVYQEDFQLIMTRPAKGLATSIRGVERTDRNLTAWFECLPMSCKYTKSTAGEVEKGRATVALHRTLLHMLYHTTVCALYRPHCFYPDKSRSFEGAAIVQEHFCPKVSESASTITLLAAELHRVRLDRFLPPAGVTVVVSAMAMHLLEIKSPFSEDTDAATLNFRRCRRVMNELRQIYAAAEHASTLMDTAFHEATLNASRLTELSPLSPSLRNSASRLSRSAILTPQTENAPVMTPSEVLFSSIETSDSSNATSTWKTPALSWLDMLDSVNKVPELMAAAPSPQQTDFGSMWDRISPVEDGNFEGKEFELDSVDSVLGASLGFTVDLDQPNQFNP